MGINAKMVKSFTITVPSDGPMIVGVTQIVTTAQAEVLLSLFKQYQFKLNVKT